MGSLARCFVSTATPTPLTCQNIIEDVSINVYRFIPESCLLAQKQQRATEEVEILYSMWYFALYIYFYHHFFQHMNNSV